MMETSGSEESIEIGEVSVRLRVDWDVGIGGSTWSCGRRVCEHMADRLKEYDAKMRVLDLGAGTGIAGLFLAKVFPHAEIVLTDLPDHLALLQANVDANCVRNAQVVALDWTKAEERESVLQDEFDLILATDCAYAERLHGPLLATISMACRRYEKTRCFLGITKSDTGPEFLDEIFQLGLEYSMLDNDEYFALLSLRRRAHFFQSESFCSAAATPTKAITLMPCLAWVQDRFTESTLCCSYCCQPVAKNIFDEPSQQLRHAASPCGCGFPYCSKACMTADRGHRLLCVGDVDEMHPLVSFRRAVYQTSDPAAWDLTAQYLARHDSDHALLLDLRDNTIESTEFIQDSDEPLPQWTQVAASLQLSSSVINSQDEWLKAVSVVARHIIDIDIPHPGLNRLKSAFLQDPPLAPPENELLVERNRDQIEEVYGPIEDEARILRRVLASPEEFLEPTRISMLLPQALPHSCAPSAYYTIDTDSGNGAPALRLEVYSDSHSTESDSQTVWRLRSCDSSEELDARNEAFAAEGFGQKCTCSRCTFERGDSVSLSELDLVAASARRDDRYDDLDGVLTKILSISSSEQILFELYRVAGWRGDFSLAQIRLEDALASSEILQNAELEKAAHTRRAYASYNDTRSFVKSSATNEMITIDGKLIVAAPGLLDPDDCRGMTHVALHHAETHGWSTSRHYSVPTTDLPVAELPELLARFNRCFTQTLAPFICSHFNHSERQDDVSRQLRIVDAFFIKYSAQAQRHLSLHTDQSDVSLTISMNSLDDFRGGGTYFPGLQNDDSSSAETADVLALDLGGVVAFDGSILHGGYPIFSGERLILAVFACWE